MTLVSYDRELGVPSSHWKLMKVVCFGEMGGPYYRDIIVVHSDDSEEIIEFCKTHNLRLDGSWAEYFIEEPRDSND